MKNICILLLAIIVSLSCTNKKDLKKVKNDKNKISKRDYSINVKNSYNDLFLDSNVVEKFIAENKLPDSIALAMRSFYNTRNYEYAWFSSTSLAEQAFGFWSLQNFSGDTSSKNKSLQKTMDDLMSDDSLQVDSHDKEIINVELMLTENFISYSRSNFQKGYVKRKEAERFVPFKKEKPLTLADSLLNKKHKDEKYFADINKPYKLLSAQLKKYVDIVHNGGWPAVSEDIKKYTPAEKNNDIQALKKFFFLTGDIGQADTTDVFNDNVTNGIKSFQKRFGYTPDGKMSAALLKEINVPATERLQQILINLNRMRWMPQEPEGRLIVVNIPEFILHMYEGKNKIFDMIVVVGKEGHNTTIFSDRLTTIVFSPYWNLPSSIVKKEIVPALSRNKNYLVNHNMEIYGKRDGLPAIRQKPGGDNSLGKVKFLFPNSFNIYFHDTPAKSLFNKDVRAYSHGCIRLSQPEKLAEYLLSDNSKWSKDKIEEAMNSKDEQYAAVKNPVPVFITYYTAWVNEDGVLNFRNDIYGHDKDIAAKMFIQ